MEIEDVEVVVDEAMEVVEDEGVVGAVTEVGDEFSYTVMTGMQLRALPRLLYT